MTKDMGKAKVISDFFALAFTDKTDIQESWATENKRKV